MRALKIKPALELNVRVQTLTEDALEQMDKKVEELRATLALRLPQLRNALRIALTKISQECEKDPDPFCIAARDAAEFLLAKGMTEGYASKLRMLSVSAGRSTKNVKWMMEATACLTTLPHQEAELLGEFQMIDKTIGAEMEHLTVACAMYSTGRDGAEYLRACDTMPWAGRTLSVVETLPAEVPAGTACVCFGKSGNEYCCALYLLDGFPSFISAPVVAIG